MLDVLDRRTAVIPLAAVRKELERLLASSGFLNAERLSRLLTFLVGQVVDRGATDIGEYLVTRPRAVTIPWKLPGHTGSLCMWSRGARIDGGVEVRLTGDSGPASHRLPHETRNLTAPAG